MNIVRVYEIEYESLTLNFRREVTGKKISNEVFIIKNGYVEEAAYHLKEKYKSHTTMSLGRILSISLLCETVLENIFI